MAETANPVPVLSSQRRRTAYFFLGKTASGDFHGYPHQAIVVAEGLKKHGWQIASDVEAWRPSPGEPFLFPGEAKSPSPRECDLLVVGDDFFMLQGSPALPEAVTASTLPAILLDRRDLGDDLRTLYSKAYGRFERIFRTHGQRRFHYPRNVRQMVFGISDRIQESSAIAARNRGETPRSGVLWNFRHKQFPHTVRLWAEENVKPVLTSRSSLQSEVDPEVENNSYSTLMLKQTEGRHFPAYYDRMARAEMAACFGGWFLLPVPQREAGPVCMWGRRLMKMLGQNTSMIAQWDSWRMWEAFAAGTTVLHLDMVRNGFLFGGPQPEAMKHYVSVDLDHPAENLLPLLEDRQRLHQIGEAGRAWALEHYSSEATASRILKEVGL